MILKPIRTRKIYEQIVDQIGQLVAQGQLQPGDRLPSERELVERFQVSRASIREALSALEMMGLIEVRSGEGTFIRQVNIESVVTPLAWMLFIEKDTDLELYEARKILEVQAAGLAAERAEEAAPGVRRDREAIGRLQAPNATSGVARTDSQAMGISARNTARKRTTGTARCASRHPLADP